MKNNAIMNGTLPAVGIVCLLCLLTFCCTASAQVRPAPVLGDYDAEPRIGNHVDTDRLVRRLGDLGANTYMWLIWHSPNDWDDLKVFLPKAKQAGITVWVYLVPHSETTIQNKKWPYSEPFRLDYIRWAQEIAKLSLQHTNLTGYVIDDFWGNVNLYPGRFPIYPERFSPDYTRRMVTAGKAINPKLKFYPLMYFNQIGYEFVHVMAPLIDGVVAAYPPDVPTVDNALMFLEDRFRLPSSAVIVFPWGKKAQAGDHGFVSQEARVTDAAKAQLIFHYRDDFDGPTKGHHKLQVRIDGQVAWEEDVAGHDDNTVTVNLAKFVGGKQTVTLSIGVFDVKGVGNFGVQAWFADLTVRGLELGDTDLGNEGAWARDVAGYFSVQFVKERVGAGRFRLPLIVMPAGETHEYKFRWHEKATPENIARRVKMATDLAQEGRIQGVVTYCLDKADGSASFEAVRSVFQAVRKGEKSGDKKSVGSHPPTGDKSK